MSKIVIITDAWTPQVNGVVVCIQQTVKHLRKMGHDVFVIGPDRFKNIPCPTYPEIRLALFARKKVFAILDDLKPDALHVNTEGPLGIAARSYAHKNKMRYTTAFQTRFPEYIKARTAIPLSWTYAFLRWFHKNSERVLVPSKTVQEDLIKWNVGKPEVWSLGVDLSTFQPKKRTSRKKKVYVCKKDSEKNTRTSNSLAIKVMRKSQRFIKSVIILSSHQKPILLDWCCSKQWHVGSLLLHIMFPVRKMLSANRKQES